MENVLQQFFLAVLVVGAFVTFGTGIGLIVTGVVGFVDMVVWELGKMKAQARLDAVAAAKAAS